MPLTSTANLGAFRLAAGEAFVVQMLVDEGEGADERAFVMSVYDPEREIVDTINGVENDDLFEFIRPGTWSEGLYGQTGLKIEIAERLKDGRAVIASPSLTVEASAATVANYTNSVIARTAVLITASFTPKGLVVATADTVKYDPGASSTPAPQLMLTGALTFPTSAASGTEVASIGNVPNGVTPTLTPNDGRLVIAGSVGAWKVVTGLSASSAGTISLTVSATGATPAAAPVTVTAGATALPRMGARVAKWSADSLPVIANGGSVPSWTDEIGGNVATTIGAVTYKTNTEDGKPSTNWVGQGTNRMEVASPSTALLAALNSTNKTVMMVIKNPTAASNYFPAVFSASAGGDSLLFTASAAGSGDTSRFKSSSTQLGVPTPAGGTLYTLGGTSTNVSNGAGTGLERFYVQGGCVATFVAPMPAAGGNTITIGNLANGAGGGVFGFGGEILDIIVWNVELTPIEVLQFQKWVCEKYAKPLPWAAQGKYTIFQGDSITAGVGASGGAGTYPYKAAQTLGLPYGAWSNLGIGGINMADMNARAPAEVDPTAAMTGVPTHLAVFEYHNQAGPAPTPANTSRAYLAARAAAGINKITFGTSTAGPTSTTDRGAYNAAFDSSHTDAQAYVPIHTNANIGVNGAQTNTTYFDVDTVHLVDAGNTVLAGSFSTQMATL